MTNLFKNYSITFLLILTTAGKTVAQNFTGKAEYFSKTTINKKISDQSDKKITSEDKDFDDAIEKAMQIAGENKYLLAFSKQAARYTKIQELEKPKVNTDGFNISVSFDSDEISSAFIDLKNKKLLQEASFMNKAFLISDELLPYDWTISAETKKIGDYICYKAQTIVPVAKINMIEYQEFLKKEETKPSLFKMDAPRPTSVTAWFTTQIPVNLGPKNYWGLPGLILEIVEKETESTQTLLCYKITLSNKDNFILVAPSKGKTVTKVQYDKLKKDKYDDMKDGESTIIINKSH